jgi:hypothetical protein
MRDNLFSSVNFIIEEIIMLQGANFISSDSLSDDILVISDRNVITGMDDNSLILCLNNLIKKINMYISISINRLKKT